MNGFTFFKYKAKILFLRLHDWQDLRPPVNTTPPPLAFTLPRIS